MPLIYIYIDIVGRGKRLNINRNINKINPLRISIKYAPMVTNNIFARYSF